MAGEARTGVGPTGPEAGVEPARSSRRSGSSGLVKALASVLLALTLGSCSPLYIPPVPAPLELEERTGVDAVARLGGGRPLVLLELTSVVEPVWMAVQWFTPGNAEAASASVWVTPADEGTELSLALPDDVEVTPGRWRAVISAEDRVLRQVSVEVP